MTMTVGWIAGKSFVPIPLSSIAVNSTATSTATRPSALLFCGHHYQLRVKLWAFSSTRKKMSLIVGNQQHIRLDTKGAPEQLHVHRQQRRQRRERGVGSDKTRWRSSRESSHHVDEGVGWLLTVSVVSTYAQLLGCKRAGQVAGIGRSVLWLPASRQCEPE